MMVIALQQRIGELVSSYEGQIAILRAEITSLINEKEDKQKAVEEYSNEILSKISD